MTSLLEVKDAPALPEDFLLGHLRQRQREPLNLYLHAAEQLGDYTRFRFLNKTLLLITAPEGIARVLQDQPHQYVKGFGYAAMKLVMGEGLVTAEGAAWHEQRKRTAPAFQSSRMTELRRVMHGVVEEQVDRWPREGGVVDGFRECLQLSRTVASRTLLNFEGPTTLLDEIVPFLQREVTKRSLSFLPRVPWKTATDRKFDDAVQRLDVFIHELIDARLKHATPPDDLLQQLVSAWPEPAMRKQLRDALVTLFLAAYETTATGLTWTLSLLARHPDVAEQLFAEVSTKPADQLTYTRQVIEESLRLCPPVWVFARKAAVDDVIGPYRVPAGTFVVIAPWVNHRLSRWWPDPLAFKPERFSPENKAKLPKFAFLPFSAGPRVCVGAGFAMLELMSSVAAIVKRYRIELAGPVPDFDPLITLQPKGGLPLKLTPRR